MGARAEAAAAAKAEAAAESTATAGEDPQKPAGPSKKERKRLALRKQLLEKGKLEETDLEVKQLMKEKPPVVHAERDCQDEAELRKRFHAQGTAGQVTRYFSSTRFSFRFLIAKDGTPVAQIVKKLITNGR